MQLNKKKYYVDFVLRDVALLGDCDEGCKTLSELLGWGKDLEEMVTREHARIDGKEKGSSSKVPEKPQTSAKQSKKDTTKQLKKNTDRKPT